MLIAWDMPPSGSDRHQARCRSNRRMMSTVPSVLPPSMMMCSTGPQSVCSMTERMQCSIHRAAFRQGVTSVITDAVFYYGEKFMVHARGLILRIAPRASFSMRLTTRVSIGPPLLRAVLLLFGIGIGTPLSTSN